MIDLLDKVLVGTETRKKWKQTIQMPPKPSELGPISAMKFFSMEKQFQSATKLHMNENSNETDSATDTEDVAIHSQPISTFDPKYVKVTLLIDTAECHSIAGGGAISIKLLELQSDKQLKDLPHEGIFQSSTLFPKSMISNSMPFSAGQTIHGMKRM
jgi:hypothetical protein